VWKGKETKQNKTKQNKNFENERNQYLKILRWKLKKIFVTAEEI